MENSLARKDEYTDNGDAFLSASVVSSNSVDSLDLLDLPASFRALEWHGRYAQVQQAQTHERLYHWRWLPTPAQRRTARLEQELQLLVKHVLVKHGLGADYAVPDVAARPHHFVDIGSGIAASWVLEMTSHETTHGVIGVDVCFDDDLVEHLTRVVTSTRMVSPCWSPNRVQWMQAAAPRLPLANASADLVHLRNMARTLTQRQWERTLDRLQGILRYRGWIQVVDVLPARLTEPVRETGSLFDYGACRSPREAIVTAGFDLPYSGEPGAQHVAESLASGAPAGWGDRVDSAKHSARIRPPTGSTPHSEPFAGQHQGFATSNTRVTCTRKAWKSTSPHDSPESWRDTLLCRSALQGSYASSDTSDRALARIATWDTQLRQRRGQLVLAEQAFERLLIRANFYHTSERIVKIPLGVSVGDPLGAAAFDWWFEWVAELGQQIIEERMASPSVVAATLQHVQAETHSGSAYLPLVLSCGQQLARRTKS